MYDVTETNLTAGSSFNVTVQGCKAGYERDSNPLAATTCSGTSTGYTLTGCVSTSCTRPVASNAYDFKDVVETNLARNASQFNVSGVKCGKGYKTSTGTTTATVATCDVGGAYKVSGCDKKQTCTEPATIGYDFKGAKGSRDIADFAVTGVKCAKNWQGAAVVKSCTADNTEYTVEGCFNKCTEPTLNVEGYDFSGVKGDKSVNKFDLTNVTCKPGYEGTKVKATVCDAGSRITGNLNCSDVCGDDKFRHCPYGDDTTPGAKSGQFITHHSTNWLGHGIHDGLMDYLAKLGTPIDHKLGGHRSMYNPPYHNSNTAHDNACFEARYHTELQDNAGGVCSAPTDAERIKKWKKEKTDGGLDDGWGWNDRTSDKLPCHYKTKADKGTIFTGKDDLKKFGLVASSKGKTTVEGKMDFAGPTKSSYAKFFNPDKPTWDKEVKVEGRTGGFFGPLFTRLKDKPVDGIGETGCEIQFDEAAYEKAMSDEELFPGKYKMWFGIGQRHLTLKKEKEDVTDVHGLDFKLHRYPLENWDRFDTKGKDMGAAPTWGAVTKPTPPGADYGAPKCMLDMFAMNAMPLYFGHNNFYNCEGHNMTKVKIYDAAGKADGTNEYKATKEKDGSWLDVEPVIGMTLAAKSRFGLYAKTYKTGAFNKNVKPDQLVPIWSTDSGGTADEATMKGLQDIMRFMAVGAPGIASLLGLIGVLFFILGLCCGCCGGYLCIKKGKNVQQTNGKGELQLSQI